MSDQLIETAIAELEMMLDDELLRQLTSLELEAFAVRGPDAVAEGEAGRQTLLGGGIAAAAAVKTVLIIIVAVKEVVQVLFEERRKFPALVTAVAQFQNKIDALLESNLGGEIVRSRHDSDKSY